MSPALEKAIKSDIDEAVAMLQEYSFFLIGKPCREESAQFIKNKILSSAKNIDQEKIENFIKGWILLWPINSYLKIKGVKYVVMSESACKPKMRAFIKNYKKHTGKKPELNVIFQEISAATNRYINHFRETGEWEFVGKAANFILHRDNGSKLADGIAELNQKTIESRSAKDYLV